MTEKLPGVRSFFKYVDPETACAILRSKSVRYSSPLKFNDPFDVQSGLHFDFDLNSLHSKVLEKIESLVVSAEQPSVDANNIWGQLVLRVRELYSTHGFPRERWQQEFATNFPALVSEIAAAQQKYQQHWNTLLPRIRVFCVSEHRDELLMWAHYARNHSGAVFEFRSLPDEDNPLSVAHPVLYVDKPPCFFSSTEWVEDILSIRKMDVHAFFRNYPYVKSNHWAYEGEWRVWYPADSSDDALHVDCPIRASEFAGVYIGCKATAAFTSDVVRLARRSFPDGRVFQARKNQAAYALEYDEI